VVVILVSPIGNFVTSITLLDGVLPDVEAVDAPFPSAVVCPAFPPPQPSSDVASIKLKTIILLFLIFASATKGQVVGKHCGEQSCASNGGIWEESWRAVQINAFAMCENHNTREPLIITISSGLF
jgi:hypothetical protein